MNRRKRHLKKQNNLEYSNQILNRNLQFISNCDQKIAICLALLGGLLAFFLHKDNCATLSSILKTLLGSLSEVQCLYITMFGAALLSCIGAIVSFVFALYARIGKNDSNVDFFSCIHSINKEDLEQAMKNRTVCQKEDSVIQQLYINYRIANKKYKAFNAGLILALIGLLLFIVSHLLGLAIG